MESVEKERAYLLVKQLQEVTWGSIVLASSTDDKQHKTACQGAKVSATQLGRLVYCGLTFPSAMETRFSFLLSSSTLLHLQSPSSKKKNCHSLFLLHLTLVDRGGGSPIQKNDLAALSYSYCPKHQSFGCWRSKKGTAPGSKRRTHAQNAWPFHPHPLCLPK